MVTRRSLLGGAAGVGIVTAVPATAGYAAGNDPRRWTRRSSANGWPIDAAAVGAYRIAGSAASVTLRHGAAAEILLHVARRWHYEIAALDTGEGGGVEGFTTQREVRADFESNYLSGTAIALHPTAYPLDGSETLWPHQEIIVWDILLDCDGVVVWGGDLTPVKVSHFQLAAKPGDRNLSRVAARLSTDRHTRSKSQTAGTVADPATLERREKTRRLPRPR